MDQPIAHADEFYKALQAMPLHELRSLVPNAPSSFTRDGDRVDGGIVNSEVLQKSFLIYAPCMQQGTITRHQNMLQVIDGAVFVRHTGLASPKMRSR